MDSHRSLLSRLIEMIFTAELLQHEKKVTELIDENDVLLARKTDGFNHLGNCYGRNGGIVLPGPNVPMLSLRLVNQIRKLLQFKKQVDFDRQMITQALVKLTQNCVDMQAMRDALPECVVQLDDWFARTYQRTLPAAHNIQHLPRDLKNYEKALTKIETYCAMRLLY